MPFSQKQNTIGRPKPESHPKVLKTIGDHIRAWRIDNHLSQAEAAKILRVCEDSLVKWEMRVTVPTVRQMPGIINMIGYPVDLDTLNFWSRITYYRDMHGMTPKEFGIQIPADASTVRIYGICE